MADPAIKRLAGRLIAALFGFPAAGENVPVTVMKTVSRHKEEWVRSFGGRKFRSVLSRPKDAAPRTVTERFGPFTFDLQLRPSSESLELHLLGGRFLGIPLPGFLLPGNVAYETEVDGLFHFDVRLDAPMGLGLIVRYRGSLSPAR